MAVCLLEKADLNLYVWVYSHMELVPHLWEHMFCSVSRGGLCPVSSPQPLGGQDKAGKVPLGEVTGLQK